MPALRMVPLASARTGFEAKVLAARLGAEGIVWQLRGDVDGVYPVGLVEVLVSEEDLERAGEVLGEGIFVDDDIDIAQGDDPERTGSTAGWWVTLALGAVLAIFLVMRLFAFG